MSRISENIRKITKACGGKTTGNGISDALSDLYNNLPFGTKVETVEILADTKTVGYTMNDGDTTQTHEAGGIPFYIELEENVNYKVVVDGKEYNAQALTVDYGYGIMVTVLADNIVDIDSANLMIMFPNDKYREAFKLDVYGTANYIVNGEMIDAKTLSITTEQETVTKIPQKYLPEGIGGGADTVVFTMDDTGTMVCNKSYEDCLSKLETGLIAYYYGSEEGISSAVSSVTVIADSACIRFIFMFFIGTEYEVFQIEYKPDGTITLI